MIRDHTAADEARATRAARLALQRAQPDDPLAYRERVIAQWKRWAQTNPAHLPYLGAWWHPFKIQTWGRRLLMPGVRAMLDARDAARRQQHEAEMREYSAQSNARRAAAADARAREAQPQGQLFGEPAR